MSDDFHNLDAPPKDPFYAPKKKRRKKIKLKNQRPEYYARLRKQLADELAKPVKDRLGKLKTLKSGDFTEAEIKEIKKRYALT